MSQFDWGTIDPNSKTGAQLALDLNSFRDSVNSLHKGGTRPTYAVAGMQWIRETSTDRWDLMLFDGDTDFILRSVNPTTNTLIPITASEISGLGTAAVSDVTTSATDTTAGRLSKVGDFGIGASNLISSTPVTDWTSNLATGVYAPTSAAINPPVWGAGGVLFNMNRGGSAATSFQIAGNADGANPRLGFRFGTSNSFKEIVHQGNAESLLGLGTAAKAVVTTSISDSTIGRVAKLGDRLMCSAMIQFNGQGATPTVRVSQNIDSITDLGTGSYVLNFTTAMPTALYAAVANYTANDVSSAAQNDGNASCNLYTTSSFRVFVSNAAASAVDPLRCSVLVFGGQG